MTDGLLWQFGRLVRDVFTAHQPNIKIDELDELFSTINYLLQQAAQSVPVPS